MTPPPGPVYRVVSRRRRGLWALDRLARAAGALRGAVARACRSRWSRSPAYPGDWAARGRRTSSRGRRAASPARSRRATVAADRVEHRAPVARALVGPPGTMLPALFFSTAAPARRAGASCGFRTKPPLRSLAVRAPRAGGPCGRKSLRESSSSSAPPRFAGNASALWAASSAPRRRGAVVVDRARARGWPPRSASTGFRTGSSGRARSAPGRENPGAVVATCAPGMVTSLASRPRIPTTVACSTETARLLWPPFRHRQGRASSVPRNRRKRASRAAASARLTGERALARIAPRRFACTPIGKSEAAARRAPAFPLACGPASRLAR